MLHSTSRRPHSKALFLSSALSGIAITALLVTGAIKPGTAFVLACIPVALATLGVLAKFSEGRAHG